MKIRKGFIGTVLVAIISLFLLITSAYVLDLSAQTVREQGWTTDNTNRSLYPLAWSAANFVLQSLYEEAPDFEGTASNIFLSTDVGKNPRTEPITFIIPQENPSKDIYCEIKLWGNRFNDGIHVDAEASNSWDMVPQTVIARGALIISDDTDTKEWKVIWR